jgi:hypothetical protein
MHKDRVEIRGFSQTSFWFTMPCFQLCPPRPTPSHLKPSPQAFPQENTPSHELPDTPHYTYS